MMIRNVGLILRLVGPLIQLVCLATMFGPAANGGTIAGIPAAPLLYGGFGLGVVLVLTGLMLTRLNPPPAKWADPDHLSEPSSLNARSARAPDTDPDHA